MIKSRPGRRHRGVRVSRLCPGELHQWRAVPRRVHCPSRAVDRCTAFAANEYALRNADVRGKLPPIGGRYRVGNHALNQSFLGLTNRSNLNTFGP